MQDHSSRLGKAILARHGVRLSGLGWGNGSQAVLAEVLLVNGQRAWSAYPESVARGGKVRSGRCVRERCFAVRCEANVASGVSKRGSVDAKRVSDFVAGGQETSWPASSFCVGATGTPMSYPRVEKVPFGDY